MGISFSCPGDAFDEGMESLFMRSISFNDRGVKTTMHSVSFNGRDSEPSIMKAFGSGKMIIQGSLSFKGRELETTFSIKSPRCEKENSINTVSFKSKELISRSSESELETPKHEAAVKLQKVYKSFRTRRQLADCAVLVEQRWWKLLDFALLRRSSVSFFDIEKPESVVSRWSRARTRAAKVGKGLSKDEKAQKLALQHWLEAIDPRHRYGHNLHFYYVCWLHCDSRQPFFYWLDVGEGKEVSLERCSRTKLQQQSIKYLGPKEREAYEVVVEDGKFFYKQNHLLLDTTEGSNDTKWIFVLSTSKNLYVGQKKKGTFQHSSFLAGGATSAAGRLVVENGVLKAVWPHSGHYRPTEENFQELMSFLKENNVDLTDVKKASTEEDEESQSRLGKSITLRSNSSKLDLMNEMTSVTKNSDSGEGTVVQQCPSDGDRSYILSPKRDDSREISSSSCNESQLNDSETVQESSPFDRLKMSGVGNLIKELKGDSEEDADKNTWMSESNCSRSSAESKSEGSIEAKELTSSQPDYIFRKKNLFEGDHDENEEPAIAQELILHRINSKKGMKSYQLGRQLSCKWTTGAGPRIGCVRDYPSELQFRALEQVNLSPRSAGSPRTNSFLRNTTSQSPKPLVTFSMK